jgi:predicted MPP superfamily phosphohydrolase
VHNDIEFKTLPSRFDSFTVLHISDLHVDMNDGVMQRLAELLPSMDYDVCVLTGDYRGATYGAFDAALEGLARVRAHLKGRLWGCTWSIKGVYKGSRPCVLDSRKGSRQPG